MCTANKTAVMSTLLFCASQKLPLFGPLLRLSRCTPINTIRQVKGNNRRQGCAGWVYTVKVSANPRAWTKHRLGLSLYTRDNDFDLSSVHGKVCS